MNTQKGNKWKSQSRGSADAQLRQHLMPWASIIRWKIAELYPTYFNIDDREDIYSSVLIACWKAEKFWAKYHGLPEAQRSQYLRNYVNGIVVNLCNNKYRELKREKEHQEEYEIQERNLHQDNINMGEFVIYETHPQEGSAVAAGKQNGEIDPRLKRIRKVLEEHLCSEDLKLIRMSFYDGLSNKKIADKLGIKLNTATVKLKRAKARAAKVLLKHFPGEFK